MAEQFLTRGSGSGHGYAPRHKQTIPACHPSLKANWVWSNTYAGKVTSNPSPQPTEPLQPQESGAVPLADRITGSVLGGALGDALASGPGGSPTGGLQFTAATQLSLYSLDGLLEAVEWANQGVSADEAACIWLAYLRWLRGQGGLLPDEAPAPPLRWIDSQEVLRANRLQDSACRTGLETGEMGTRQRPVNPEANGPGAVMRSGPFGLLAWVEPETVAKLSQDAAALTHGHPAAAAAAAVFSLLVHSLLAPGTALEPAAAEAVRHAADSGVASLADAVAQAVERPAAYLAESGGTETSEQVLARGLAAVLAGMPEPDPAARFRAAVERAAAGGGAGAGAAGSVAGTLLGTFHGSSALPAADLAQLEGRATAEAMAASLIGAIGA